MFREEAESGSFSRQQPLCQSITKKNIANDKKPLENLASWIHTTEAYHWRGSLATCGLRSARIKDAGIAIRHSQRRILFYTAGSRKGVGSGGYVKGFGSRDQVGC